MDGLVQSGLQPNLELRHRELEPSTPTQMQCWISFGGNVGDVKATFDAALALLSLHRHIELGPRSGLYCSAPMGAQSGSEFLNSICGLKTRLNARQLLCALQSVETQLGRVRDIYWGPRTLDLDLLSYGCSVIEETNLIVPHPALTYRRFVLDPLAEVAAEWRHPLHGETTREMLGRIQIRPLPVKLLDVPMEHMEALAALIRPKFPDIQFVHPKDPTRQALLIRFAGGPPCENQTVIDLRRSPGDRHEKLTAAFTAIFDKPLRISDW
ncbi:2-amino-4-hydroxy-6-hydroxymethyldihydropteridine diphosphokinase [Schlesneria sp.]|uniref:2-amino-4-hydroxy-6- hydroxymethyldihydropteridine diphosphokinase n=1 Tax=Schlesneria sp. TaxID=2762018 RepID=UPI002F211E75